LLAVVGLPAAVGIHVVPVFSAAAVYSAVAHFLGAVAVSEVPLLLLSLLLVALLLLQESLLLLTLLLFAGIPASTIPAIAGIPCC
jgi:hypothetical protein